MRRFTIVVPYHDGAHARELRLEVQARHVRDALDSARRGAEAVRPLLGPAARLAEAVLLLSPRAA